MKPRRSPGAPVIRSRWWAFDLACYAIGVAIGATLEIAARAPRARTTS